MKVIINGACGRMGSVLLELVKNSDKFTLAAAVDKFTDKKGYYGFLVLFWETDRICWCLIREWKEWCCVPPLCPTFGIYRATRLAVRQERNWRNFADLPRKQGFPA